MTYDPNLQLSPHFRLGEFISENDPDGVRCFMTSPVTYTARLTRWCHVIGEPVRARFGPVHIDSGFRSPQHNRDVGGRTHSEHLEALAGDMQVANGAPSDVATFCEGLPGCGGVGRYATFTHADIRDRGPDGIQARWDG